jgi:hypothetical protein
VMCWAWAGADTAASAAVKHPASATFHIDIRRSSYLG